jgi:hypothetical protein
MGWRAIRFEWFGRHRDTTGNESPTRWGAMTNEGDRMKKNELSELNWMNKVKWIEWSIWTGLNERIEWKWVASTARGIWLVGERKQKNEILKCENEMTEGKRWKWNRRKCRVSDWWAKEKTEKTERCECENERTKMKQMCRTLTVKERMAGTQHVGPLQEWNGVWI